MLGIWKCKLQQLGTQEERDIIMHIRADVGDKASQTANGCGT